MVLVALLICGALTLVLATLVAVMAMRDRPDAPLTTVLPESTPLAILGDSDSHSFQDSISFAAMPEARGGAYHDSSFNWPEVLARLRGDQLDLGDWGTWGNSRERYAIIREALGMRARLPRKQDYRYNFAFSGAQCDHLMNGRYRQAPRLLALMDQEQESWRKGVVVIRIGINSFGGEESLNELTRDSRSPQVVAAMEDCVAQYRQAITSIQIRHPDTRFVLVGIFNNAHWAKYLGNWRSPAALDNISRGLEHFDDDLREIVAGDPEHLSFFDDRAWFKNLWGSRDAQGDPAYRDVVLNGSDGEFRVHNTVGDDPSNATLQDGHTGTVWSGLWAKSLVELLNARFSLGIRGIEEAEILELIDKRPPWAKRPADE